MHVCFFNMYFNFIYFSNSYSLISFWFLVMLQQDPIDNSGYFLLMGLSWINSQYLLSLPASLLLLCVCLTLVPGLIPQRIKRSPLSLRCLGSFLGSSLFPTNKLSGVMQWTQVFPAYWSTPLQYSCLLIVPKAPITIGMTDTQPLHFQILICTSTF